MTAVILTDPHGKAVGKADLLEAHTGEGKLHRAFSVYVFRNGDKELLVQKRSEKKMLWPLYWANTCCSHPRENETAVEAGTRRLQEELGFVCPLTEQSSFVYRAVDPAGRGVEHEFVTILVGNVEENIHIKPNSSEVTAWKWMNVSDLLRDFEDHPNLYAPWFPLGLNGILQQGELIVAEE